MGKFKREQESRTETGATIKQQGHAGAGMPLYYFTLYQAPCTTSMCREQASAYQPELLLTKVEKLAMFKLPKPVV